MSGGHRLAVVLASVLQAVACHFDPSASPGGLPELAAMGDAAGAADAQVDAQVDAGLPDAQALPEPDAPPACVDRDDDGVPWPNTPGASCGSLLDCDDQEALVFPGQTDAFTVPTTAGSYDYDCDGLETPQEELTVGGGCLYTLSNGCGGTGWIDAVPGCGEVGTWHVCSGPWYACREESQSLITISCR